MPSLRRELLLINGAVLVAALVFGVGHIPGVVNSATLIAVGSSLWATLRLIALVRRMFTSAAAPTIVEHADLADSPTPRNAAAIRLIPIAPSRTR